jgi:hypothetical protein
LNEIFRSFIAVYMRLTIVGLMMFYYPLVLHMRSM